MLDEFQVPRYKIITAYHKSCQELSTIKSTNEAFQQSLVAQASCHDRFPSDSNLDSLIRLKAGNTYYLDVGVKGGQLSSVN